MATLRVKRSTGSTAPSVGGITFGEPAFVDGLNSFYIAKNDGSIIKVGAEVDSSTSLGTSNNKIPTQNAVKTYIDNNVAAGAVSSLNGLTGAVFIGAGTAIQLAASGKGITLTNTGVQSAVAGSGISVSGATGAVTIANTGVTGLAAGTGISVTSATGNITVTNTGVTSLVAGNQATVSASTGAVTIGVTSNPSFTTLTTSGNGTVGGNLTVTGNLTVNGTTTTVNSDSMTVDDPIITLGTSGGAPITVSDGGKDRGIAFTYFNNIGKTGFFGYDTSEGVFSAYGDVSISGDVVTHNDNYLAARFAAVDAEAGFLRLGVYASNGYVTISTTASTDRTVSIPDWGGYFVITPDGGTPNYILSGTTGQPTWIDSNSSGFTAFTSTNVLTASDTTDTSAVIAFLPAASATNQGIKYNSGLTYNAVTNSLSATTFVGSLSGNASTATTATSANTLTTSRSIGLTGDVSGSASFNGSADINITATIAPNSVALGTDTTGNYIATLSTTAGAGLTISGSGSENAAVTINLSKVNTGIDFGNFAFTTGEFTNSNGTVAIGTVDGGTF